MLKSELEKSPTKNQEMAQTLPHLPYMDGWRGFAIILVLIDHFSGFIHTGEIGVTLFFVLSGFLMTRILLIKKTKITVFYQRRIARIIPSFWLYVFIVYIFGYIFIREIDTKELFSVLFFFRTYYPEYSIFKSNLPIGHIWSLNVEEHSYIYLSIISIISIKLGSKIGRIALTASTLMCLIFFIFYKYIPPNSQSIFTLRSEVAAFPLLASCTIFLWLNHHPIKIHCWIPLITLAASFFINFIVESILIKFIFVSILLAISVNTLQFSPAWWLKLLSNSTIRWFGICSFSLYLWQQPFFFMAKYTNGFEYWWAISLFGTLAIGSLSYYFFESPMRTFMAGRKNHISHTQKIQWQPKKSGRVT